MEKRIAITKENREFLAKAFKVTDRMVWKALTFEGNSELAQRIRNLAIKRGGIVINTLPEVETLHDSDGYMRQYFPNGAVLECDKSNGHVDILFDGKAVKGYDNVMISQLEGIQNWAGALK